MAEIVLEVVGRIAIEAVGAIITGAIRAGIEEFRSNRSASSSQRQNQSVSISSRKQNRSLPVSSQRQNLVLPEMSASTSSTQYRRAILIASSNISFGNDCERLVNIDFQTSQTFPTMMGRYADVSEYISKELAKQYPGEYFHIIIGQNEKFGFSIDDGQYFAEIQHEQYHVVIFTTKQNSHTKLDTHDANSQMLFVWK